MLRPAATHACTVDVEDYNHVSAFDGVLPSGSWDDVPERVTASTECVLQILSDAGVKATFFILGRVAKRCPGLVKRIADSGHEIGCHSDRHCLVYQMSPEDFRDDLQAVRNRLEDLIGDAVVAFRAPSFSIMARSLWALDILAEEGFTHDSSIFPVHHDRYGMPSAPFSPYRIITQSGSITEFPPTTVRLFGRRWPAVGGGYFRLYPYRLTAWAIRQVESECRPVNLYVHPWEFDPDQPRVKGIGMLTHFRHYVGLRKTEGRLKRLLSDFRFGSMSESLASVGRLPLFRVRDDRLVPQTVMVSPVEAAVP